MDPERYAELMRARDATPEPDVPDLPDPRPLPVVAESSEFAVELLERTADEPWTGGELLVLFEEAALADLRRHIAERRSSRALSAEIGFRIDHYLLPEESGPAVEASSGRILLSVRDTACDSLERLEGLIRRTRELYPEHRLHGVLPGQIHRIVGSEGTAPAVMMGRLRGAGLDGLRGLDASVLAERVRSALHPEGPSAHEWISIAEEAVMAGLSFGVTLTVAGREDFHDRVEHLLRVRETHAKHGRMDEFSLRFSPTDTPSRPGPEQLADYLRTTAIARIALGDEVAIAVETMFLDREEAQECLLCGADRLLGGTARGESALQDAAELADWITSANLKAAALGRTN